MPSPTDILFVMGITTPPVPVELLAQQLGIEFPPECLSKGPEQFRFWLAHFVGHLSHHTTCSGIPNAGPDEVAANVYAAELLMPDWMFTGSAAEHGPDKVFLARLYGVSEMAAELRLQKLRIP